MPLALSAQRVDLDKFKFTSQFRQLPLTQLDTSYHTYQVSIETTRLMQGYLADLAAEKTVEVEGWKQLDQQAHLIIRVKLEDLLPESVNVSEREEIVRDRSGKETGRRKLYSQQVTYTFAAFAEVEDYRGAHIRKIILADRDRKQVYRSPEFAIKAMADGYFMINSLTVTRDLFRSCATRALRYLSERATEEFGYGTTTVTEHMWIVGNKKHPEYQAHRQAFLAMSEVLFNLRADKPLGDALQQLEPAIKYFESIKRKYPSTSKHDRKIRYASYYNLAVMYYYLDDPQSMQREASALVLNDFDARDGKNLEAGAQRLKQRMLDANRTTRHFAIDTTHFRGPRANAAVAVSTGSD